MINTREYGYSFVNDRHTQDSSVFWTLLMAYSTKLNKNKMSYFSLLCSGNASGKYAIPTDHINITISAADLI
jgi:hypothetical protein